MTSKTPNLYHITLGDGNISQSLKIEFKAHISTLEIINFFDEITYLKVLQIKKIVYDFEDKKSLDIHQVNFKIKKSTYKEMRFLVYFQDKMTFPVVFRNFIQNATIDNVKRALLSFIRLKVKKPKSILQVMVKK